MSEVLTLIALMQATYYDGWTDNKEGWDKLRGDMSGKQAKECRPAGVTFDAENKVTKIELFRSGLKGILFWVQP